MSAKRDEKQCRRGIPSGTLGTPAMYVAVVAETRVFIKTRVSIIIWVPSISFS